MTPFTEHPNRVATISLTKQQEEIVRKGFDKDKPFEEAVAQMILEKLKKSLELTDILLGPVGHTRKDPSPGVEIDLDLLG